MNEGTGNNVDPDEVEINLSSAGNEEETPN